MRILSKANLKIIAILSISIYCASNAIIAGMIPFMQKDFGISRYACEFLITLSAIFTVVAISLSEIITRKIGIKKTVEIGLLMIGISSFVPIISKTYPAVFLSRIILGFGIGIYNGNAVNYISQSFEPSRANSLYGIRNSMEYVGQILLLIFAGVLIKVYWVYGFLAYSLSFLILIFFHNHAPNIELENDNNKFYFNSQVIFYMVFAGFTIMNIAAINVRFPTVAKLSLGINANINMYMTTMPIIGMISGFLFGKINKKLEAKTILLGLLTYIISNILIGVWGYKIGVFLVGMLLNSFSQSMCAPYIFSEVSRFSRGGSNRIVNNLIFIGCNLGGFFASPFLNLIDRIIGNINLTLSFLSFSIIFTIFFIIYFKQFQKNSQSL